MGLTEREKVMLATVLDCEGYIGITRSNRAKYQQKSPYYAVRVCVAMTVPFYPALFAQHFGGCLVTKNGRHALWKEQLDWSISSRQAIIVLETLLPYLNIKTEQAKNCLEFMQLRRKVGHSWNRGRGQAEELVAQYEQFYQRSRTLNARGKHQTG